MIFDVTLNKYSPVELIGLYGQIIKELKDRNVIRTNNFIGEIGEYLAIQYYLKTPGLPKLQAAPPSTKNIDAISIEGDRYSIKCTTSKTTGVFMESQIQRMCQMMRSNRCLNS